MKPWERLHLDFATYGAQTYLLIVDAHSKWPEIFIVQNMNSNTVIAILNELFARFGYPLSIVSDNQSTFVSREFRSYLQDKNIKLNTIPPYHAASNGQAERLVGALKLCLRTLNSGTTRNPKERLLQFLQAYRRAPHSTTGQSPAMLFLKREITTPLSLFLPGPPARITTQRQQVFQDPQLREGDRVAIRDFRNPLKRWKIGTVVARDGQLQYTVLVEGELHRKHIEHLRKISNDISGLPVRPVDVPVPAEVQVPVPPREEVPRVESTPPQTPLPSPSSPAPTPKPTTPVQRPRRNRRLPGRFSEFVMETPRPSADH